MSRLLVKEYEDNDFYLNQKYKQKILRPAWDLKSVNKALGAAKVASKKGTYKFKSD